MQENDEPTREEWQQTLAAARAWAAEFAEEGAEGFDPLPALERVAASSGPPAAPVESSPALPDRLATPDATPEPSARSTPSAPVASPAEIRAPALGEPVPWAGRPTLDQVREFLGDCTRCGLCEGRRTIVFGSGNPDADLMFIGEGPGENEDRQGLPFVGRAGDLLTQMIEKGIGIARSDVYICNIVKCRPPGNRTPGPLEVKACKPFLDGQIDAVSPKVIVSLGKPAAALLLDREIAITRVRGTWQTYRGIPLMPTLHPAYVLRQYTPENRRAVWEDLKAAFERTTSG